MFNIHFLKKTKQQDIYIQCISAFVGLFVCMFVKKLSHNAAINVEEDLM